MQQSRAPDQSSVTHNASCVDIALRATSIGNTHAMRTVFVFILALVALGSLPSLRAAQLDMSELAISVPITDSSGTTWAMRGRICQPLGVERPRFAVINHGSPPKPSDRPGMKPEGCDSEVAIWFAQHRIATVFVMRLGYGETGGPWAEGYKTCNAADYAKAGLETARQIDAIVRAMQSLEGFDPHDVIVVGQSAGGWGTMAYASQPHSGVTALINMAGGRGGHYHDRPNSNCEPEHLVDAAAQFGATARTPMLWIYAQNDSFFNPALAKSMADAFQRAGAPITFVAENAFGQDGHHLFAGRGGSRIWGPLFESYLSRVSNDRTMNSKSGDG